jgi:hypothetical protein
VRFLLRAGSGVGTGTVTGFTGAAGGVFGVAGMTTGAADCGVRFLLRPGSGVGAGMVVGCTAAGTGADGVTAAGLTRWPGLITAVAVGFGD